MRKFVIKSFLFIAPVLVVFIYTLLFYKTDQGDLIRIGYVAQYEKYNSEELFEADFKRKIFYKQISELDYKKKQHFRYLIIGDSFSDQEEHGYVNFLAENNEVLYFDRELHDNPLETVFGLLNGNFFEKIEVDVIIVQSVERSFVERAFKLDSNVVITTDTIKTWINDMKWKNKEELPDPLFSDRMKKFVSYNFNYMFDDNAYVSKTYKVETTKELFSVNRKQLLFYGKDLESIERNSDEGNVSYLNDVLNNLSNRLKAKEIDLLILPAPDKYNVYYNYISNRERYLKPSFFEVFNVQNKNYDYLNLDSLLKNMVKEHKDIYLYDDTHWSPIASKEIADKIHNLYQTE